MNITINLLKLQKAKAVIEKVRELNGTYEVIAKMDDSQKQSQTIDAILNIDTNPIDINSLYGWNEHVRRGNIKHLILKGVVPTEENIKNYQNKVNKSVEEMLKNIPQYSVPVIYRGHNKEILSTGTAY